VSHGDQWAIYKEIENKYSGVNNFLKAIGVELKFSNPYHSANSSLQSSRQNSDDDDEDSTSHDKDDEDMDQMLDEEG
jgi:hypothetical protein